MLTCRLYYRAGFYVEGCLSQREGGGRGFKMESKAHDGGAMRQLMKTQM